MNGMGCWCPREVCFVCLFQLLSPCHLAGEPGSFSNLNQTVYVVVAIDVCCFSPHCWGENLYSPALLLLICLLCCDFSLLLLYDQFRPARHKNFHFFSGVCFVLFSLIWLPMYYIYKCLPAFLVGFFLPSTVSSLRIFTLWCFHWFSWLARGVFTLCFPKLNAIYMLQLRFLCEFSSKWK